MFLGMENYLPVFGMVALLFVFYKTSWVTKQDPVMKRCNLLQEILKRAQWHF